MERSGGCAAPGDMFYTVLSGAAMHAKCEPKLQKILQNLQKHNLSILATAQVAER